MFDENRRLGGIVFEKEKTHGRRVRKWKSGDGRPSSCAFSVFEVARS